MKNEELRAQLEHLQAELQQAESLNPEQREVLRTRADDIERMLNQEQIEPQHYQGLGERLNEDVAQLEASHPQITLLMRRVIDSLAYLGI